MNISKILYGTFTFIAFFILFIFFFHPIPLDNVNSDLGRHLTLGEVIVNSGHVPKVNLFSYTFSNYPFINTHWLSEVIFYLWHNILGFDGLILLSIILITTAFSFIFVAAVKNFSVFPTIIISLIYLQLLSGSGRTQVRPELVSFLFLSIFIVILYKYREKYTKWIFALILIQLLWVNFHIYFFLGIAVLVLFLLDAAFSKRDKFTSTKFLTIFLVTIAASLSTLFNPNFIKGAFYPLFVLSDYSFPVLENKNFFSALSLNIYPIYIFFIVSVGILWVSIFLKIKKIAPIDFLLSIFFTFMALFAIRNFPLFVFGTFIPAIKAMSYVLHDISDKYTDEKKLLFSTILFISILIATIPSIKVTLTNQWRNGLGLGVIDNAQDAVNFLIVNNIKGNLYNNFDIGNYLIYRLYPQKKVFVDNRPEAYPKDFSQNIYFPMQKSQELFEQVGNKYNFSIVFIAHTDLGAKQMLRQLAKNSNWKMVYLNNSIVIFLKNNSSNRHIIDAHLIDENNVSISESDISNKNKVAQLANFFSNIGWSGPLLNMNLRYLYFEPSNCEVLKNVINLMQKQSNSASSIYVSKYLQFCNI